MLMESINKKKLIVLGASISGVGAAKLAKQEGWEVFVSDYGTIGAKYKTALAELGVEYEEGKHTMERILTADLVVKSPGIPNSASIIKTIKEKGIAVIGEIEFAAQHTDKKIIAITGSNGKTTTTAWTEHLLKSAGLNAGKVGNIGFSFAEAVANRSFDIYVVEVSSFQLEDIVSFQPDIAVITNITPDHLDRYNYQMQAYVEAKFRIQMNQTASNQLIYNADDPETLKYLQAHELKPNLQALSLQKDLEKGDCQKDNSLYLKDTNWVIPASCLSLKGKHNLFNGFMAAKVAQLLGADLESVIKGLGTFESIPHRLEIVAHKDGVTYINDSKATNVDSVWYALDAMTTPIVWVIGGQDKGNDYSSLMDLAAEKVKSIICLGLDNRKLYDTFGKLNKPMMEVRTAKDAVEAGQRQAVAGDVVLLSPACTSFDLFNNYMERGDLFRAAAQAL